MNLKIHVYKETSYIKWDVWLFAKKKNKSNIII